MVFLGFKLMQIYSDRLAAALQLTVAAALPKTADLTVICRHLQPFGSGAPWARVQTL